MNRVELVAAVAKSADLSKKDADAAVKAVFDTIADALAENDKVQLIGFGTFDVAERAAREGRNPRTGATMNIEASKAPRFKAGKALKDNHESDKIRRRPYMAVSFFLIGAMRGYLLVKPTITLRIS